jgi:hypothetical protein
MFSQLAFGQVDRAFLCHWASNGDNFFNGGGTGWENYPNQLFLTIVGIKARTWSDKTNAGPVYEGEHNNNAFDGGNEGLNLPGSLAFRAKSENGLRRFIYIPEDIVFGKMETGRIVLYVSNPLKQWAFVYFDCSI